MAGLSAQEELLLLRKRARRRLVGAVVIVLVSVSAMLKVIHSVPDQPMKPESIVIAGEASAPAVAPAQAASVPKARVAASSGETELPPPVTTPGTELPASLASVADAQPETARPAARPTASAAIAKKQPASAARAEPKPADKPQDKPADKPAPRKVDPAAILEGRVDGETGQHPDAAAKTKGDAKFEIQLAALSDSAKVDALRGKLAAAGVTARFNKVETSKGPVTRVRVGPFPNREAADAALRKLARAGVTGIIVSR